MRFFPKIRCSGSERTSPSKSTYAAVILLLPAVMLGILFVSRDSGGHRGASLPLSHSGVSKWFPIPSQGKSRGDGGERAAAIREKDGTGMTRAMNGGELATPPESGSAFEGVLHPAFEAGLVGQPAPHRRLQIAATLPQAGGPLPVLAQMHAPIFPAQAPGGTVTQAAVDTFRAGLEQALAAIEANLIAQVFGDSLPLVGDHLAGAASQGLEALHYVTGLKTAINSGLPTLTGSANYAEAQVEQAINNSLTGAGTSFSAVNLDAANASDIKLSMNTGKSFAAFNTALDAGFGIPGLGLQSSGSAQTTLTYTLNFGVGVDAQGFYFNTANNASTFSLGLTTTVPGLDVSANLARLHFRLTDESATDGDSVPPTAFTGTFSVDLLDPSGADNKLRANELGGDLLDAKLTGSAVINLNLASDLGTAMMPAISEDLNFSWAFSSAAVTAGDANADFGAVPSLAFKNVKLDLGTFFTNFARPVLEEVRVVSEPLQPISDAVTQPIPLLDKLHQQNAAVPQSLLDMAVSTGSITRAQADQFDILAKVIRISNAIPLDVVNAQIDLGDFDIAGADPRTPTFRLADILPRQLRTAATAAAQNQRAADFLNDLASFPIIPPGGGPPGKGLTFPILSDPKIAIGLLTGQDVDLFALDNSTQILPLYNLNEFVKLIGPLGIRFQGTGKVRLDLDFGFDTHGIIQFATGGDPAQIANGFHIKVPTNAAGQPIPIAELTADFNAALAVNLGVVEGGAGGRLDADVHASVADPSGDKRVHLDEFLERFNVSPLCVFEAGGALTFGLRAYVTVGVKPVAHTWNYDVPLATLADYSFSCLGPNDGVPVLARIETGDARLHVGPEAFRRAVGNVVDGAEGFTVTHRSGAAGAEQIGVSYAMTGGSSAALGAQPYGPVIGAIRGDGGADDDTIVMAENVLTQAVLTGSAGNDQLTGGTAADMLSGGIGRDVLTGRTGDDTLLGEDGDDLLEGGPGADILDGGPGYDAVTYAHSESSVLIDLSIGLFTNDAFGDVFTSIEQFEATSFSDTLIGTGGPDVFYGLASDDVLDGRDGDDVLEGGAGADQLIGGNGFDIASYWRSPAGVQVNLATGATTGGDAQGDVFSSIEGLEGSTFGDTLVGDANSNRIYGLDGRDTIDAGDGDDFINGGGGPSTPGPPFPQVPYPRFEVIGGQTMLVGVGGDDLVGGPGNDTVSFEGLQVAGHTGNTPPSGDRIVGVTVNLATGVNNNAAAGTTLTGIENIIGTDYGDDITGDDGPNLIDPLHGGGYGDISHSGPDRIDGGAGEDTLRIDFSREDLPGSTGVQTLSFSAGDGAPQYRRQTPASLVWSSDDIAAKNIEHVIITGASKDDQIRAATRNYSDFISGLGGNDRLEGYGGSDTLLGGDGDDEIFGLSYHTEQGGVNGGMMVDGNDFIDGGAGDDYIDEFYGGSPAPLHTADARLHLDGGPGFDTLSVDFGNESAPIVWDSANPTNIEFPDGSYARKFEQLRFFGGSSGNDVITQHGRVDNFFHMGDGDDTIDLGIGIDTVYGGAGNDLLILDFSVGDTATSLGVNGGGGFNSATFSRYLSPGGSRDISYAYDIERMHITGTSKNDDISGIDGPDMIFGGEGDDTLTGGVGSTPGLVDNNYLNGGPGNDTLYGSRRDRNVNGDDTLIGGEGNDVLVGRSGSDILTGGPGDDMIYGGLATPGQVPDGTDVVDAGDGNDFVTEMNQIGSSSTAAAGTRLMLDGGPGFDTLSVDVSRETESFVWNSASPGNTEFSSGSYLRNFEAIKDIIGTPGNDVIIQRGRLNNNIDTGAGDDVINPGLGIDQINPGTGNNLLIFDFSAGDDVNAGGLTYSASTTIERHDITTNALVDQVRVYSGANDRYQISGTSKANVLRGGSGADVLFGGAGNDSLDGGSGNDVLTGGFGIGAAGSQEVDRLHGASGADVFVLGDASQRFYDDQSPGTPGTDGYAIIDDFTPSQGDRLRLFGAATQYLLGASPIAATPGTALYHDSNRNGSLDTASDELIAIIMSPVSLTPSNTIGTAAFATVPDPALFGLTAMEPAIRNGGAGARFEIQFSILEAMPAGQLLEVQASSDLGATDPWLTIASKSGSAPWAGPATVTVSAPSGGKVVVTVTALQPFSSVPMQFLRFQLSNF